MSDSKPLTLESLAGGFDDQSPMSIANDACTVALNVEFYQAPLGGRRFGCDVVDITSSHLNDETDIVHISQWFPANDITVPEWWGVAATPGVSATIAKRTAGVWSKITPIDAVVTTVPNIYNIVMTPAPSSVSSNGKLFIAYPSAVDRLHVWDPNNGAVLRRVGLAEPNPPTLGNGIVSAVPATPRFYRIRLVRQAGVGIEITARSEPSTSVAFTPDGVHAPRITHPSFDVNESATHWEVEGSFDDINYYVLQSLAVATTFWDDTFTDPISFSEEGELSEDIGTYLTPPSAAFLLVTDDRLIMAGHQTDISLMSTVWWTPVKTDPAGGNDERLPLSVNNSQSLDNYSGGPITGIAPGISGSWYVFKASRIYKMTRTGDPTRAYTDITLTTERGAVRGSVFNGLDSAGRPCIFFTDPQVGPCMLGTGGLQRIMGLTNTWKRVNVKATSIIVRGLYYNAKSQAHWWVSVDGANTPNLKLVLQVDELQVDEDGQLGRGWSLATGVIAQATAVGMLTESVTEDGNPTVRTRPFIGLHTPNYLQRCDASAVDDAGTQYVASIRSKPFTLAGLLDKFGAMNAAIFADAVSNTSVVCRLIRDMGLETSGDSVGTFSCSPVSTEDFVIRSLDDLVMSEAKCIQIEFSDPS